MITPKKRIKKIVMKTAYHVAFSFDTTSCMTVQRRTPPHSKNPHPKKLLAQKMVINRWRNPVAMSQPIERVIKAIDWLMAYPCTPKFRRAGGEWETEGTA